jgi:hypothetical protein
MFADAKEILMGRGHVDLHVVCCELASTRSRYVAFDFGAGEDLFYDHMLELGRESQVAERLLGVRFVERDTVLVRILSGRRGPGFDSSGGFLRPCRPL